MTRAIDGTSVSRSDKTPWEGLSMAEKAALMKEAVDNGVYDLKAVRSGYDSFVKVAEPVVEEVSISEPSVTDGVPLDKLRRSLEDFYVNIEPNVYAGGGNKSKQRVNPLKQQFLNTMEQALKESSSHNSAQWRKFLTDLADMESSYNANITNNIGAKGYFQLMPFNRAKSWSSPTQQFHEMFKLTDGNLDYFKKNLTKEDWAKADRMGIDIYGLLAGAHLGGVKGALNALRGKSNAKDSNGTSVMHYMKKFSQHPSRDSIFSNLERQVTNLKSQAADFVMRHSNSDVSELQENIFNTDNTDGSWHVPMMLPSNPTVFSNLTQFTQPSWIPQRPDISEVFKAYDESKKQEELAEKQAERQQHMNNMRFFMNLMDYDKPKSDGSSFMSTIGMLAGNGMNNNPYSLDSKGNGGNSKGSELTLMPMFGNMYAGGDKIERRKGVKGGEPVEYYDASEVMPIVADNMGKSIVLDEVEVTPYRKIPIQDTLFEGITTQAANERADEYTNKTSLTPGRFLGLMGANVPLAAGALGATVAAPALFDSTIAPLSDYIAGTKAGQTITGLLGNPYFNAAVEAGFAGHGLNHAINEGIDGWGDAAMTALEVAPLGKLARPIYEGVVRPGIRLFNSPLTGKWTKIGNREYRLSPNTFGANSIPIEWRKIGDYSTDIDLNKMHSIFKDYEKGLTQYKGSKSPSSLEYNYEMPKIDFDNLVKDDFVDYLSAQTGRKIKRVPIKDTKHGDIYNEGFAFVDDKGKELAHIAGTRKAGKNVFVESSYVDPEFRYKGLGKQMYFDLNDHVFSNYGTTLHSDPMQRVGSTGVGMSPSNRLWKSLRDNGMSTVEGEGFNRYDIMAEPSKITTAYRTLTNPQITAENAANITPEQWIAAQDAAYKNAVMSGNRKKALELLDEAYKRSGVPETMITMEASGHPKIWYTGSEYGNHTIFDSSKFNATIGGESAVGKIKGNFLTTDLPSAARYAGSGVGEVHEFTEPSTFLERFQNIFGMYRPERIHPTDRIPEILRPKPDRLFTIKDAPVVDYLDETDKVVYPMYVNPGERVYTVDFKGNPWSRSPVKFPNSFSIKKTIRDDIAKTYRDEIVPFKDRETAVEYYKSLEDRFGKMYVEDPSKLNDKYFPYPGGDRSVEMFASAPTYEKASLIETHTPATTNGAVQTAEREGYTSVYMPNVIDSNVRDGVPYAIDDFVTLDSRQMKIADITYDDAGELIPLSKRFNWNKRDSRYDMPNSTVIESRVSAKPNISYDEAYNAAAEGRHDMKNLVGPKEYADRVRLAYRDNNLPVNQADFEIMEAAQNIKDSKLKVVPNLKNAKGEALNGQYNLDTGEALIAQDRDNILDIARTSGHEHAHASEVEKLLNMLKKKWAHIKPRKEAYTNSDGSLDTEWKDYISKITEMRAPAMSVWSGMKKLGFNKVGDYLAHLSRLGMKDKQWEALVDRYGIKNAKYMVETVFGISPLMLINKSNDEKEISTAM